MRPDPATGSARPRATSALTAAALLCISGALAAQAHVAGKVDIHFDRYSDSAQMVAHLQAIAAAYPEICRLEKIGESLEGRPLYVAIVNDPATGDDSTKPAMWIDGNVHGNEIQAGEAVLYSIWYLTKAVGQVADLTELLQRASFYFLISQNPDGRQHWFDDPSTPHSSRWNLRAVDNDRDGLSDEDGPDDLDGDGSITSMWQEDPDGEWRRSVDDPRVFERVSPDQRGGWRRLEEEGIDNDGDGQVNEDGPGGDDMNRSWPTDWQPTYVQNAAGEYPLSQPETRAIAKFILAHPNIAAGQTYHNAGGMILRGPGVEYLKSNYPRHDLQVYQQIARKGEDILPYYRSMVIWSDLYTVHGCFCSWLAEGQGIISFTNELWSDAKYFQRDVPASGDRVWLWRDRLAFGQTFADYKEFEHPTHGKVLIGGPNRWSSRVTPTFMLEEECHRNFAFTMLHASEMPELAMDRFRVEPLGPSDGDAPQLWSVTVQIANGHLIPTRTAVARERKLGSPDLLLVSPAEVVVAAGRVSDWHGRQMDAVTHEPARLQVPEGIAGHSHERFRFIVRGKAGDAITFRYTAEKARAVETIIKLEKPKE